ncbi:MAG: thermonuclease family protein [Victivallales bacterium]|nr:thermonuclease family protein [Victivallales bacterium]
MAEEFHATVVAVFDGDTIRVLDAQRMQHKIRLDAIDAPETGQAYGTQAKKYLSSLVVGREVRIVYTEKDRYGRILGTVFIGNNNVNLMVVEAGYAWHYVYFAKDKLEYAAAEARAKKSRRGLWADTRPPLPPWDYRKAKKTKQNNDVSN